MYIIKELPQQIATEELSILLAAEPATIGHFVTKGILSTRIKPISKTLERLEPLLQ